MWPGLHWRDLGTCFWKSRLTCMVLEQFIPQVGLLGMCTAWIRGCTCCLAQGSNSKFCAVSMEQSKFHQLQSYTLNPGRGCLNLWISWVTIWPFHVIQNKRCNLKYHPLDVLSSIWLSKLCFFKPMVQKKLVMKSCLTAGKRKGCIWKWHMTF